VTDSAGNVYRQPFFPGLRPIFPPHRLELRVVVPTTDSLRADSAVEITDLAVPADNIRMKVARHQSLRGERIRFQTLALGGRGRVDHKAPTLAAARQQSLTTSVDGEPVEIQVPTIIGAQGMHPPPEIHIDGQVVHLLYDVTGLTADEVAQVTAVVDDQGRSVPFTDTRFRNQRLLFLKPEPDAQAFRVRCELIDTAKFDFIIAPPAAPSSHPAGPASAVPTAKP